MEGGDVRNGVVLDVLTSLQLSDGEEFEDTVFDLREPVVVGAEDRSSLCEVVFFAGVSYPREGSDLVVI